MTTDIDREIWERLAENPFIRELLQTNAGMGGLKHTDGSLVKFDLKVNQNLFLYWDDPKIKGLMYCWTPHKDTRGWYWSFIYKPKGNVLKIVQAVKFRKRKAAKQRAADRFNKANSQ